MSVRARERLYLAALLIAGAVISCIGITWGLPSRAVDPFLFGDREPWPGRQIQDLAGQRPIDPTRGADVDATPLMRENTAVVLNATNEQRARILIRYRLYSFQPDEMITLMSLAEMRPRSGELDPKLYQYGGFWIYPVGALLYAASKAGLIRLERNLTYYLDAPEQFGRFYVVARLYAAAWGLIGAAAVYWLARRLTTAPSCHPDAASGDTDTAAPTRPPARSLPSIAATAAYLTLPVVINMAHEAKPHLPGAAVMLLAVCAAVRYVETGARRWWLAAGALCGLSFGTVLSALPIFVILPVMILLRPGAWPRRLGVLVASTAVGGLVYAITNPYVPINWFTNRAVLESNLQNSLNMYAVGSWADGLRKTAYLLGEAATPIIAVLGLLFPLILAGLRWDRVTAGLRATPRDPRLVTALLLGAPAALAMLQFLSLAAGKPSEYGRFLVFPATVLTLAAVSTAQVVHPVAARRWQIIIVAAAVVFGSRYLYAFYRDARPDHIRRQAAEFIAERPERTLLVPAEPAPYNMPPVDLFRHHIVLEPTLTAPGSDQILVFPADHPDRVRLPPEAELLWPAERSRPLGEAAISWADKPILVVGSK